MQDYTQLKVYLSNTAVLVVKLHNLHWNVVGRQFVQIHEFTESLYDDFFEKYDDVAEIMKMQGEAPLVRMVDYLENATILELAQTRFTPAQVLEIVRDDLQAMKDLAVEIRNAADEAGNFEVVAMFEEHVAGYSKNLWFINSMMTE